MVSEIIYFVAEVTIGFEHTNYLVKEGNVIDVCAVLTGTLKNTLDVLVNSSSGSATGIATSVIVFSKRLSSR